VYYHLILKSTRLTATSYNITGETIKDDLTGDRPIWPLSSYGPGKNAPLQLMEGDVEQSPEEMRVRHYLAVAKGNPQESVQLEAQFAAKANEAIQRILADVNGAIKYIIDGKDQHPNRLDMQNNGSNAQPAQQQNAFGAPAAAPAPVAASGFGQPSGMGQQGSAFGKPAFGQPAAQSTFGQASAFGKPSQPGFGQASAVGGGGSAFGQPSQPAQNSGFGQPSAIGGGAASAFGQPSAPGQSTGFGQPSQVGKPAFGQSAFGQPSQPAQPAFGQASKPAFGQASAAGQPNNASPFGAAATQPSGFAQAAAQPATGFGQPSAFGAAANKPNPFSGPAIGQLQQKPSPFGAAPNNASQQQQANPFGASPQPAQSAFGQPSQPAAQQNPFGTGASNAPKPAFGQPTQPAASAFGQPSQPTAAAHTFSGPAVGQLQGQPQQQATGFQPSGAGPDPSTYLTLNTSTKPPQPTSFKNQRTTFLSDPKKNFHVYENAAANNQAERLWFPTGPPVPNPDIQLEDVYYEGALGEQLKGIYEGVAREGVFGLGGMGMPEVPPRREWVRFDL
jgi:nucleoporin NUP42